MKNTYSAIRLGLAFVFAFSAFTGVAFAAPVLTPASATVITDTTATFTAKVANPGWKTTTVWFEYGETKEFGNSVGMRDVFSEGFFQAYVLGLNPGTTYYFRAAGIEGGETVYSSVSTFKTQGNSPAAVATSTNTTTSTVVSTDNNTTTSTATNTAVKKTATTSTTAKAATTVKKTVAPTSTPRNVSSNNNTASLMGAMNDSLPGTLMGWISLFIGTLLIVTVWLMVLDSAERKKKMREEARKRRELEKTLAA